MLSEEGLAEGNITSKSNKVMNYNIQQNVFQNEHLQRVTKTAKYNSKTSTSYIVGVVHWRLVFTHASLKPKSCYFFKNIATFQKTVMHQIQKSWFLHMLTLRSRIIRVLALSKTKFFALSFMLFFTKL
jgi:hypothetical protein